ncbi:MAG: hypothetical protein J6W80_04610 [Kiritimatiellae bacterium]|nr:hypothetical protein [Kiritimatiellia bacterium]
MATKSAIATTLEYGALRLFCGIVRAIPYRVSMAVASGMASFAVGTLGFQRERTMKRLRSVFPDKPEEVLVSIAKKSLANVLQSAVEMIIAPKLDRKWMDSHIVNGKMYKDRLQQYVDEGNGVVIMVPHAGNWYMAAWSMAKYGLPLVSIAAKQRNEKIDAWMKRQYCDIEILDRGSARTLVDIKDRLKNGRAFAILPDLRVPQRDVEADFLGGKANVSHAGATFAVNCGSPIVVAMMSRENGKHVFNHIGTLRPNPDAPDKKEEAARLTKEAMALISKHVMEKPEQWFWYNKRWILQPVD